MPSRHRRRSAPTARRTPHPAPSNQTPAHPPWLEHPTLVGLRDRLQLVYDCWSLLELPDGSSRRPAYLHRGVEEPELCYQRRLTSARPSGFFRDALRTYAGMLSRLRWLVPLPDSLSRVLTDVDGNGTDLGVFLFLADLLALRDAGCLLLLLPQQHRWPSEGDRLEAIRRGDRLSLPRLQLVPRSDLLNWQLPTEAGVAAARASGPERIVWREPRITPQPPNVSSDNAAVGLVVLDACGAVAPDPQAWLYRSLAVNDDGLLLQSWLAEPNPADPSGYSVRPAGPAEQLPHRYDLPALWYSVDGAAFGQGELPHLGLAHQYLNHYCCRIATTCRPSGIQSMGRPLARANCRIWAWRTSTSTTTAAAATTRTCLRAPHCRWGCAPGWWIAMASRG